MASDLWRTPPEVVDFVRARFGRINVDLCASGENSVADFYLDECDDFLNDKWLDSPMIDLGELAFCNPPYSNPLPFVSQCVKWSEFGFGVFVLLNNDTSTKWFEVLKEKASIIMPITGGRLAFLDGDGNPVNGNNKPQCMFYLAPFGRVGELQTRYVDISEIYPNGKPRRSKNEKVA